MTRDCIHNSFDVSNKGSCRHWMWEWTHVARPGCRLSLWKVQGACEEFNWFNFFISFYCKVLVRNMNTKYQTCSSYCSAVGRDCTGAWEERNGSCAVKSTEDCHHNFGSYTSDAICECGQDANSPGDEKIHNHTSHCSRSVIKYQQKNEKTRRFKSLLAKTGAERSVDWLG